ncbi:D-alanyl-D-alanine carboxypeptidase [Streptomyces sp.]|uniref:D-alanyl-D-alanine carboxypeptidase family protein n=1 Tax=Streptomyces sp. TaxID=1931 RepID=UPI002811A6F5|nr:D-alanyl-D-alanine carboxypeptidase [Streptomyces sp.]
MAGESPDRAEQQGSSQETTDPGSGVPRRSAPVQVDQPTAVFKSLTPRTPEDDAGPEPAPEPTAEAEERAETGEAGSERLKAAVAAWVATAEDEGAERPAGPSAAAPAEGTAADERSGDAGAAAPEDGKPETAGKADEAPSSGTPASGEPVKAREESAGAADSAGPVDSEDAGDSGDAAGSPASRRAGSAGAPAEEPVDQPTTMFRAVRPPVAPAPAVDQPTTALKLPQDLRGPKGGASGGDAPDAGPDSDSERTSTFVPLRPDIPAERKPQEAPKSPAASAGPTAPAASRAASTPSWASQKTKGTAPAAGPEATPPAGAQAPGAAAAPAGPASLSEPERTRQQPMPPLPPLDLLAELTNTPPPPPTVLRTTMRRVRIWTPLVLLLLIVFAIAQMVRPLPAPALTLTAAPTFTFQGGELRMPWPHEGQGAVEVEGVGSMGTYGPQKPAPIASVAKTMTAYVILRDHPIKGKQQGPEISVDKKAGEQAKAKDESTAQIAEGQTYSEKELLQLLMIPSGNNVARLLARWDAGSEEAFVRKMNAAAKDLGMTQSTYTDPSGLSDSTVSTPLDQLKLARAVMQYDVFREIVNMPNLTVEGIPGRIENNNNILLEPGVSGIKTGSSTPAGGNLLWSANTVVDGKDRRILGIVMGAKDARLLHDKLQLAIDNSLKLIQKAQADVTSAPVVREGQVLGHVDDGLGGRTPVVATKELKAVGWPGLRVKLELTDGGKAVPHSAKAGDVVGQVSIGEGAGKVSAPVALQRDLVEPGFDKKLTRLG